MTGQVAGTAEKLRAYLRALKPGVQALLVAELERGLVQGTSPAGTEMVLAELRRAFRERNAKTGRFDDGARLLFKPVEPFLVDDVPNHRHRGRLARTMLEPLWLWLTNNLIAAEVKTYAAAVEDALMHGHQDAAEAQAREMQDLVAARIGTFLQGATSKDRGRLSIQLGTERALEDIQTLRGILASRDALARLNAELPGHIAALNGPVLEQVKAQVDAVPLSNTDLLLCSLILLMSKMSAPWQLIQLAVRAAGGDDAKRIADSRYAVTVEIVLEDVDCRVRELAADLKSGRGFAVTALLKEVHDALRGLRSEINASGDSAWGKKLAAIRADISKVLTSEIELLSGRVRRLIRPRPAKEITSGAKVDPDEVAETEALIGFVAACRNYASELAINEVTLRVYKDLQQMLEAGTRALVEGLRGVSAPERAFRLAQVDAAVRFCAKVFGAEYAALLSKAAEVAAQAPKAVSRAS